MRTTININYYTLQKFKEASETLQISKNDLIAMLINTVISKKNFNVSIFTGVKYQDTDPENKWRKLHITFEPQIYEKALDLKKASKFSVSYIITFSIIHFLDEIVEKLKNGGQEVDNYPLNYIFIAKKFNDIQGFIIFWGIPEEETIRNLIQ